MLQNICQFFDLYPIHVIVKKLSVAKLEDAVLSVHAPTALDSV
jgi:hypothetical protein